MTRFKQGTDKEYIQKVNNALYGEGKENPIVKEELLEEAAQMDAAPMSDEEKLAYIQSEFGLEAEKASEIMDYINDSILPNEEWMAKIEAKSIEKNRTFELQLIHDAHYMLYKKEGGKYAAKVNTAGFMGLPKVAWIAIIGVGVYYAYSKGMFKKLIK
jgi:predicted  nucleic acid-binding Zn-ribbon protein